jgi:hypothetical protein
MIRLTANLAKTMLTYLLPKILFWAIFGLIMALFRRIAPPRARSAQHRWDESQTPEPLSTGIIGSTMWALGIGFALLFFALRSANHWWASLEGPSILTQYATSVLWCFFPGFGALALPWPLMVWYLRKVGRWEEADNIEDASDSKGRMNSFRVIKWLGMGVVAPIGFFTLLAIPIHLSISDSEVRVGHYGSFHTESFPLKEARRMTIVDGYRLRDGSFHPAKDVLIDFADGRRLRGNAVGDGGTNVPEDIMQLLIEKTGLAPKHVLTADQVSPIQPSK